MGFLSNLFGFVKDNPDDEDEDLEELEDDEDEDESSSIFRNLFIGIPLNVVTKDNQLALSGKLTSQAGGTLTLERLPGSLAFEILPVGEPVFIRGFTTRMEQFNLTGTVQESSRVVCRLTDIQVSDVENQRMSFRTPVQDTPAWLYRREDEHCRRAEECMLVDVSTGGCCIESEYVHEENEVLRIKIKLEDYQPMLFLGQIIRASEYGGKYRYGILFAQLREDELTSLTRTLYNIQVGNRRTWGQSQSGHWH